MCRFSNHHSELSKNLTAEQISFIPMTLHVRFHNNTHWNCANIRLFAQFLKVAKPPKLVICCRDYLFYGSRYYFCICIYKHITNICKYSSVSLRVTISMNLSNRIGFQFDILNPAVCQFMFARLLQCQGFSPSNALK